MRHLQQVLTKLARPATKLVAAIFLSSAPGCCLAALGQMTDQSTAIHYNSATKVFRLDGADVSYFQGINELSEVRTLYWGKRLAIGDAFAEAKSSDAISSFDMSLNTTPHEFVAWGGGLYVEPDLKISFPDGDRDVVLKYTSHKIQDDTLIITMKDQSREVYVTLKYRMDKETGILSRSALIENRTSKPFTIEQVASGTWNLPRGTEYRLRYLTGRWAAEWNVQEQPVRPGKVVLESRRGTTGAQNNPWFAIDDNRSNDQDQGNVWFGALGWSGSWQISVEQDQVQQVRVTGGPNTFDFAYRLGKGESLETPAFYGGFSDHVIGGASRLLHRYEVGSILPGHPSRLLIQNGFTYAYSPGVMMAWVTDSPNWVNQRSVSLEYRFLVAMQGSLGIGANLNKWAPEDFAKANQMVGQYKAIRETAQRGQRYRLITPENNNPYAVTETVSPDGRQVVFFAFLHSSKEL